MTNIRLATIILTALALLLTACAGPVANTPQSAQQSTTSAPASANRFVVTGYIELTADNVATIAYSTDASFSRVTSGAVFHFIQLIDDITNPSGSVNISLSPAVQVGTYELLDSGEMSPDVYTVSYVARVNELNRFYTLTAPGTLTITQLDGSRISGSFEFSALRIGSDTDQITVSGTFDDVIILGR